MVAKLSAVADAATHDKRAIIARHGTPKAVALGFAAGERLSTVPSFGRL
jgi:uncharacterized protein (DUF2062 family)